MPLPRRPGRERREHDRAAPGAEVPDPFDGAPEVPMDPPGTVEGKETDIPDDMAGEPVPLKPDAVETEE